MGRGGGRGSREKVEGERDWERWMRGGGEVDMWYINNIILKVCTRCYL